MAIRSMVCIFALFILAALSSAQILIPPNTLVYGNIETNNGVNMTQYRIQINDTITTSYQIRLIRTSPISVDDGSKFYVTFNSTEPDLFNNARTSYTIDRLSSLGDWYVAIYAAANYSYAIQYCPGTCSDAACPSLCFGQGGCNITSLTCTCDNTIWRWSGSDCSASKSLEDGTKIWGMTIAVFVVVAIIIFLVCVALPIILILVCCCGVCVAAGVAANDGNRTREYRIIQTNESQPLIHGHVVYKV